MNLPFLCKPVRCLILADITSHWPWLMRVFSGLNLFQKSKAPANWQGLFILVQAGLNIFSMRRARSAGAHPFTAL